MMIPDVRFEAEVLRAALLLGLVREHDVNSWADALLPTAGESVGLLADVALIRPELTALREVLRPLAEPCEQISLGASLLTFLATDPAAVSLPLADRIRVLAQLRREDILGPAIAAIIKAFEDRWMLAAAGVSVDPSIALDLDQWLATARGAAYYRISVDHADERAALLAALSRKLVRDRRAPTPSRRNGYAWSADSGPGAATALIVNETLWRIAVAEFSPLPLGSRIPYPRLPEHAVLVLDEATAEPMGIQEASDRLAVV